MPQPAVTVTYAPCTYCGCIAQCECPVPSAPMERGVYRALTELRPSDRSTLALTLSNLLTALQED